MDSLEHLHISGLITIHEYIVIRDRLKTKYGEYLDFTEYNF